MKMIISCIALTVLLFACSKEEAVEPSGQEAGAGQTLKGKPGGGGGGGVTVTTLQALGNSAIQSTMAGMLTGGSNSFQRGFCCSTSPGPTISDITVMSGYGNGEFWGVITGLTPGTTYYARAFAKKSSTVYYGNEKSFTTLTIGEPSEGVGIVTDIDGNEYNTVTYGDQVWMVENLQVTHYRDGTPIAELTDNAAWAADTIGAYCIYGNNAANKAAYGLLYNKYAVLNTHNIAPAGWHVPSYSEMMDLLYYLGGLQVAGGRMKETGFDHWLAPNTGADNTAQFNAVGAGRRDFTGAFDGLQQNNYLCTGETNNPVWVLGYDHQSYGYIQGASYYSSYGFPVRCVMD